MPTTAWNVTKLMMATGIQQMYSSNFLIKSMRLKLHTLEMA
jgi:hypothetical protein